MGTVWVLMRSDYNFSQKNRGVFLKMRRKATPFGVVFVVDDTRLELVTSRTSSGCATNCANESFAL